VKYILMLLRILRRSSPPPRYFHKAAMKSGLIMQSIQKLAKVGRAYPKI
jgi:hypothetical protein